MFETEIESDIFKKNLESTMAQQTQLSLAIYINVIKSKFLTSKDELIGKRSNWHVRDNQWTICAMIVCNQLGNQTSYQYYSYKFTT